MSTGKKATPIRVFDGTPAEDLPHYQLRLDASPGGRNGIELNLYDTLTGARRAKVLGIYPTKVEVAQLDADDPRVPIPLDEESYPNIEWLGENIPS